MATTNADLMHLLEHARPHDQLDVNIFLHGEPAHAAAPTGAMMSDAAESFDVGDVVDRMKAAANSAQAGLLDFLGDQTSFASFTDESDGGGVEVMGASQ